MNNLHQYIGKTVKGIIRKQDFFSIVFTDDTTIDIEPNISEFHDLILEVECYDSALEGVWVRNR